MRRTRSSSRFLVRVRIGLTIGLVAASALAGVVPESVAAAGEPRVLGTLERFPSDAVAAFGNRILPVSTFDGRGAQGGTLIGLPRLRRLLQIFPTSDRQITPTGIAVRDMDSLKMVHHFELPVTLRRGAHLSDGGDWMHAIDGDRRIFFLARNTPGSTREAWSIVEVDLKTYAQRIIPLREPYVIAGGSTQGLLPGGLEYDPHSDALLLVFGGLPSTAAANVTTQVHRIELKTDNRSTRQIRACSGPLSPTDSGATSQFANIITERHVFFTCQRAGSIGAVVRIDRNQLDAPNSPEDIVAGPAFLETSFADPASGRLFLITLAGEVWAFDTATMAFVGVVAASGGSRVGGRSGYGFDTVSGRLFFQSYDFGVGIAEARFYPIPQARTFRDKAASGQERIIGDAKNGRIFVLTGSASNRSRTYTIYDVGVAPTPPPPPNPDRSTTDVAEQPGVTESKFFASGTGYGMRVLLAKGFVAVPPAPAVGETAPTAQIINRNVNSKCGYTDRELVAGRVAKAEYDTGSTAARAVGVDVDERTKLDLAHMSRCDVTVSNGSEVFKGIFATVPGDEGDSDKAYDWDTVPASCTSSSGGEATRSRSEKEAPSSAETKCPTPGDEMTANAVGYLNGAVAVGRAETKTTIWKTANSVISEVVAEAHDINIAGVLFIGEVTSVARSRATGRPGPRPMSDYTVTVKGVRNGTTWLCKDQCDLHTLTEQLNLAFGGRVEFRTENGLDETLRQGTPKGALTAVQKSSARQASDQALVGDPTTEVAGLEMIVYNDNTEFGRARQIYQFAGVATAATYNIVLLPTGAGFDNDGLDDDEDFGGFDESAFSAAGAEGAAFLPSGTLTSTPNIAASGTGEGIAARALRTLARGIRMFLTNPRQALLLLTAWSLFSLPPVLSRRRRLLAAARAT